jgi:Cytochrome c554 and c-prime
MNLKSSFTSSSLEQLRIAAACILAALGFSGLAENMYQPKPMPGGINACPSISSLNRSGTNWSLSWYGLRGGYQVQTAATPASAWVGLTNLLASTFANTLQLPALQGNQNFFRLQTDNSFVGSGGCSSCHADRYSDWLGTLHAGAWGNIATMPPATQKDCIVCHTVGFGQPTGFTSIDTTPHLAGVGCENCHGPGAAHKYGDHSLARPAVTIATEVCGGCHDGSHHPTYSEWTNTLHATVTPDVASGFNDTLSGQNRMATCGPCHSGATRLAMLKNYEDSLAGNSSYLTLPSGHDASAHAVTCAVCHDPHRSDYEHQLRNPISSTNNFTFRTGAVTTNVYYTNFMGVITTNTYFLNTTFATQYDASIQICGQCHNDRGASWTTTSRPPHHSPQYNMLLGTIGELSSGEPAQQPGSHAVLITNQCVGCHMPTTPYTNEQQPASSGHSFRVESYDLCQKCHTTPESLVQFTTNSIWSQIQEVKSALDLWATTTAPEPLRVYGTRAWEYTSPGSLSSGGPGPTSAQQALIPVNIKKARFNMYLVLHDGSYGVHNVRFAVTLLDDALSWISQEIGP